MFADQTVTEDGHPVCYCGTPVLPNDQTTGGDRGTAVVGSKGIVIVHVRCTA
jgi:hypothetical protein